MEPTAVDRASTAQPTAGVAPPTRKNAPAAPQPGQAPARPLTDEERLLRKVSSDQLFGALKETRDGPTAARLRATRTFSAVQRGQRKNMVFAKLSKGKDMHKLNVRMQKSFKDMLGGIRDLRIASQMKRTGPDYLVISMNRMLVASEGYMGLMRPLAPLMLETNVLNRSLSSSLQAERTELNTAARLGADGIEELPEELSQRGMLLQAQDSTGEVREGMEVGKFYFDWTRESLSEGISLVSEAVSTMRTALTKGREYLPDEAAEGFEKRVARLEARQAKASQQVGGSSAGDLSEREKLEKGRGLKMSAEEGAMRRMEDEKSRMQEGLWAALSGDSFGASL